MKGGTNWENQVECNDLSLFLSNVKLAAPGPVTQLDYPLADEDGDDEDD